MPSALELRYALIQLQNLSNREDLVETIRLELKKNADDYMHKHRQSQKLAEEVNDLRRQNAELQTQLQAVKGPSIWQQLRDAFRRGAK